MPRPRTCGGNVHVATNAKRAPATFVRSSANASTSERISSSGAGSPWSSFANVGRDALGARPHEGEVVRLLSWLRELQKRLDDLIETCDLGFDRRAERVVFFERAREIVRREIGEHDAAHVGDACGLFELSARSGCRGRWAFVI